MLTTVALTTLGCKVNQVETEAMTGLFKAAGYKIVPFGETADIYVINTCSVTGLSDRKSRQIIRRAHKQNQNALIAVVGCYAGAHPEEVRQIPGVRVIVGVEGKKNIVELVEKARRENISVHALRQSKSPEFEDIPLYEMPARTRAFLKIEDGCQNFCSYCIIPYTRGAVRSRSPKSIHREAERLVKEGFSEIVLTGIHLGMYGSDLPERPTLTDACREILSLPNLRRLRLGSLESVELDDELLKIMQNDKRLMPFLHLPLQSGSDVILQAMRRHYTTDQYAELLKKIRAVVPNVAISTDLIVGFPGETDELFQECLNFVKEQHFTRMHIFPYSRREGTLAAAMPNQIPPSVKKTRTQKMQKLAAQMSAEFICTNMARETDVLFETYQDGITDGLTDNYLRVYVADKIPSGEMRRVRLAKPYRDGLWGELS